MKKEQLSNSPLVVKHKVPRAEREKERERGGTPTFMSLAATPLALEEMG